MAEAATRDGYGKGLVKIGSDRAVVVLDAGMSDSTRSGWFKEKYPERFFNMGISEGDMVCTAAGIAKCGKTVFASSFASFLLGRSMDQLLVSVAYSDSNVKIAGSHGGLAIGEDGPTAQALGDVAYIRALPNFLVLVPADAVEAEKMVVELAKRKGPAYIRLGRPKVETIYDEDYRFEVGNASVVAEGGDAAIIASGIMVQESICAAEILRKDGINASIINMSTIKPLDRGAVIDAAKTGIIITAEDHNIYGGLGSAVAEVIAEEKLDVEFGMIGIKDRFAQSGSKKDLFKKYGLDSETIADVVKKAISGKR